MMHGEFAGWPYLFNGCRIDYVSTLTGLNVCRKVNLKLYVRLSFANRLLSKNDRKNKKYLFTFIIDLFTKKRVMCCQLQ